MSGIKEWTVQDTAAALYREQRESFHHSAQYIFDVARVWISMADAEMMAELKAQAATVPVKKAKPDKIVEERDADGVVL